MFLNLNDGINSIAASLLVDDVPTTASVIGGQEECGRKAVGEGRAGSEVQDGRSPALASLASCIGVHRTHRYMSPQRQTKGLRQNGKKVTFFQKVHGLGDATLWEDEKD